MNRARCEAGVHVVGKTNVIRFNAQILWGTEEKVLVFVSL